MGPRRLLVLTGTADETALEARTRLSAFEPVDWGDGALGSDAAAVVVSLHGGFDPDALGRAVGRVRGGGVLVVCLPQEGPPPWEALAVWPHGVGAVGTRMRDRLLRALAVWPEPGPLAPLPFTPVGSPEQAAVVAAIAGSPPGSRHVVIGARGRGKSAAAGLATRGLAGRTVVTSAEPTHADTVRAYAPGVPWVDPIALAGPDAPPADTIVVDEAASLPVPVARRLVERHPDARFVFATTVHGYEGSGRGFVHRFLPWLRARGPVTEHTLRAPIRWDADDPLERWADDLLLLDAVRAPLPAAGEVRCARVEPTRLAGDEALLRDVVGLLVEAHYRTTPADLARVLDAPNLTLFAAFVGARVAGVALVAEEGGLPPDQLAALGRGVRVRGHALPETLVAHAGAEVAGSLRWIRSVRLATDPSLRGRGVATALVGAVEAGTAPDGFGTLFGATPELLRFRRGLGYLPVRLSASRGARSGEPSVVLVKPVSPAAASLVASLRADLARDLPAQLALCAADGGAPLDPELVALLSADLPAPSPVDPSAVDAFLAGRPFEAAVAAIEALVADADLSVLTADERALVVGRVSERRSWAHLAAGHPSVPAAMRSFRRAIAALAGR
jgi:tRNA(Met) cytidine acetyltransferase